MEEKDLRKIAQDAVCKNCDNYRQISFYNIVDTKACYCGMDFTKCVLAKKKG